MGIAADFVLIILAGLLGGLIARALRLPLLIGYILAGIVVGPHTAGPTVTQVHDIELLAEIGVALLLFSLGLEISFGDLRSVKRIALWGGPVQIALTALLGALCGMWLLGIPAVEAAWLGAMVSVSSTMVVLKLLASSGRLSTLASRVMIGLLVVQDLAVVLMLIVLPRLGKLETAGADVARAVLIAAAFLAVIVLLGTRLLPPLLAKILTWGSRELFLVAVVAAGVGIGSAAYAFGLSFALGAFIAGVVLSESDLSHQALSDVVPLRDIFGLLFFVTVGMLFDPRYALSHPREVLLMTVCILTGKALVTGSVVRLFGYINDAPWLVGLGLAQIGEFSFVLARAGQSSGALSSDTYNLAIGCTILSMVVSPLMMAAALPLSRFFRRGAATAGPIQSLPEPAPGGVIVAGFGRTGRAVAKVLRSAGLEVAIVEMNHAHIRAAQAQGFRAIWGDVSRPEILAAAGLPSASLCVLALADLAAIKLAARTALQLNPSIELVARALQEDQVQGLRDAGVSIVIQPEFEGGIAMVRQVLAGCGREPEAAARLVESARAEFYAPPIATDGPAPPR